MNSSGMDITLRQMNADDASLHQEFIARLGPDDLRFRFGARIGEVPHSERHRIAAVDHEAEATFVAIRRRGGGGCEIVGEVRAREDAEGGHAEFAIAVRPDLQRQGVGRALLEKLISFCRARQMTLLYGLVHPSNASMLALARRLGFHIDHVPGGTTAVVSLEL